MYGDSFDLLAVNFAILLSLSEKKNNPNIMNNPINNELLLKCRQEFLRKFQKNLGRKKSDLQNRSLKLYQPPMTGKKYLGKIYHPSLSAPDLHYNRCNILPSLFPDSAHYYFSLIFYLR